MSFPTILNMSWSSCAVVSCGVGSASSWRESVCSLSSYYSATTVCGTVLYMSDNTVGRLAVLSGSKLQTAKFAAPSKIYGKKNKNARLKGTTRWGLNVILLSVPNSKVGHGVPIVSSQRRFLWCCSYVHRSDKKLWRRSEKKVKKKNMRVTVTVNFILEIAHFVSAIWTKFGLLSAFEHRMQDITWPCGVKEFKPTIWDRGGIHISNTVFDYSSRDATGCTPASISSVGWYAINAVIYQYETLLTEWPLTARIS